MIYVILTIVITLIILIAVIVFIVSIRQIKYNTFVLNNSIYLKRLKELNAKYIFHSIDYINLEKIYDNKKFFDSISCQDYLIYHLPYISKEVFDQIDKINENNRKYKKYLSDIENIKNIGCFQTRTDNLNIRKLIKIESKIAEKEIQRPKISFYLKVTLKLSDLYEDNIFDQKSTIFYEKDIFSLDDRINDKRGSFYNDREIWDAICRVERGKVSNKLRFKIYKRDGYKCCKCGSKYNLEIDHIKPVSKGGKSTEDNLQALCHYCNKAKGSDYYY